MYKMRTKKQQKRSNEIEKGRSNYTSYAVFIIIALGILIGLAFVVSAEASVFVDIRDYSYDLGENVPINVSVENSFSSQKTFTIKIDVTDADGNAVHLPDKSITIDSNDIGYSISSFDILSTMPNGYYYVDVYVYDGGDEIAQDYTSFYVGTLPSYEPFENVIGIMTLTDNDYYEVGENVLINSTLENILQNAHTFRIAMNITDPDGNAIQISAGTIGLGAGDSGNSIYSYAISANAMSGYYLADIYVYNETNNLVAMDYASFYIYNPANVPGGVVDSYTNASNYSISPGEVQIFQTEINNTLALAHTFYLNKTMYDAEGNYTWIGMDSLAVSPGLTGIVTYSYLIDSSMMTGYNYLYIDILNESYDVVGSDSVEFYVDNPLRVMPEPEGIYIESNTSKVFYEASQGETAVVEIKIKNTYTSATPGHMDDLRQLKLNLNFTDPNGDYLASSIQTVSIAGGQEKMVYFTYNIPVNSMQGFYSLDIKLTERPMFYGDWCDNSDINRDGNVDSADEIILTAEYGRTDCDDSNNWCDGADINMDGSVYDDDADLLSLHIGLSTCTDHWFYIPEGGEGWCNGADITKNGDVGTDDATILTGKMGRNDCSNSNDWCDRADISRDGKVDSTDQQMLYNSWGMTGCVAAESNNQETNMGFWSLISAIGDNECQNAGSSFESGCGEADINGDGRVGLGDLFSALGGSDNAWIEEETDILIASDFASVAVNNPPKRFDNSNFAYFCKTGKCSPDGKNWRVAFEKKESPANILISGFPDSKISGTINYPDGSSKELKFKNKEELILAPMNLKGYGSYDVEIFVEKEGYEPVHLSNDFEVVEKLRRVDSGAICASVQPIKVVFIGQKVVDSNLLQYQQFFDFSKEAYRDSHIEEFLAGSLPQQANWHCPPLDAPSGTNCRTEIGHVRKHAFVQTAQRSQGTSCSYVDLMSSNMGRTDCASINTWCSGTDINRDGNVTVADSDLLNGNMGRTDCSDSNNWCDWADINRDGNVDNGDIDTKGSFDVYANRFLIGSRQSSMSDALDGAVDELKSLESGVNCPIGCVKDRKFGLVKAKEIFFGLFGTTYTFGYEINCINTDNSLPNILDGFKTIIEAEQKCVGNE